MSGSVATGKTCPKSVLPFICIGVLVLCVYLATSAPSLVWVHWGSDGGDLITSAATGRVSHPPGSPVYHLLASAVVHSFPGDPARLLNFLSATMATGAVLLITATLRRRSYPWSVVAPAALTLAFAPWLWSQAVITEVYTTGAFFGSLAIYLGETEAVKGWLGSLALGVVLGFGISVHLSLAFLCIFMGVVGSKPWWAIGLGLLLGMVPYLLLLLFGPWPQPWGDLRSIAGWWDYVTARMYWGNAFTLPLSSLPQRVLAWFVLTSRQFTPPGLALICVGLAQLWRERRRVALGIVATWLGISIYALGYNTVDSWVYLVPFLPFLTLALAEGLAWIAGRDALRWVALAVPLALLVLNWTAIDVHADREAIDWVDRTLDQLPSGALVQTTTDRHTFALWYAIDALGKRDDLTVVDLRLWGYEPYMAYLGAAEGVDGSELEIPALGREVCDIGEEGDVACR